MPLPTACPCGLPDPYADCCGPLHDGRAQAVTAEQLMRSRYSAFVVGGGAYHTEGTVEFRASYREAGREGEQRENSRFVRADGAWVYERAV